MGNAQNDFVLDSKGHCFLCLDEISAVSHGQELVGPPFPFPKYSLHCLSRYLNMDMRKVFNNAEQIPSELLAKVENSRLKVELCEECVSITEEFSENYHKLEKAEMRLGSSLKKIHAKFLDTKETENRLKLKNLIDMEPQLSSGGELEILEVLRDEAFQKSHSKLRAVMPRVQLRNLTKKAIRRKRLRFKADFVFPKEDDCSKPELHVVGDVKMEVENPDTYSASNDDNHFPLDDSNPHYDAMSDDAEETNQRVVEHTDFNNTNSEMRTFPSLVTNEMQYNSRTEVGIPVAIIDPETGKLKCATCEKQFSNMQNYKRHQKSVHVGVKYACSVCNKAFSQSGDVRKHQRKTDCGKQLGLGSTSERT